MNMNENSTDRDFDPETAPDLSADNWQEKFDKAAVYQDGASKAGFLESIQADLVDHNKSIASTLLKLRLLAAKLGSDELTEWIKYEAEGYPQDDEIPTYRVVPVSFTGTFQGPFGGSLQNVPIPPLLIMACPRISVHLVKRIPLVSHTPSDSHIPASSGGVWDCKTAQYN